LVFATASLQAADWSVPLAGNAFRTAPAPGTQGFPRGEGGVHWKDPDAVYSVFFRIDRPAVLQLAVQARGFESSVALEVRVAQESFSTTIDGDAFQQHALGRVSVAEPGYVRVDLRQADAADPGKLEIRELVIASETEGLTLDYVRSNQGSMFYWGRRGPSVHLRYAVPTERPVQYAYSEVTVPVGEDPIGSYFMANGFGEGYFGIQVNGPAERRVLFSVWSPFRTDNPDEIPADQRIVALAKGRQVQVGEFGNEGSGGQSYLVYPWKAGTTYRFLTEVRPDGKGNTIYTSWFGNRADQQWRLIASFRRPQTDTHLRGFHAFLENFSPAFGYLERRARYGNVWVRDVAGQWHACRQARFSVDATGRGAHRLDFAGGTTGATFFLRNGGFFDDRVPPGTIFRRTASEGGPPEIAFAALPRD